MLKVEMKGLDALERRLKRLQQGARELNGENKVSFSELFDSAFMTEHSSFRTMGEMFSAGGFTVNSEDDFRSIPDDVWDAHVAATTSFPCWSDMSQAAVKRWASKKLGF